MDAPTTSQIQPRSELWQQLADNIPQLAWIADPAGDIFWYNRRWYDYTGTTLEEMAGWGWQAVHHPDRVDDVVAHWSKALASGDAFEEVFPLKGRDGKFRSFLTRAQPLQDEAGRITHWFGTNTDISEQLATQRRNEYLVRLEDVLARSSDPAEVKLRAMTLLGKELAADRVTYTDVDLTAETFTVGEQYLAPGARSIAGTYGGPAFAAVLSRYRSIEPMVTSDYRTDRKFAELLDDPATPELDVRAVLDIPIAIDDRLTSILSVHQAEPREWTDEEIDLVRRTAARTSAVIARQEVADELERSEERLARATRAAGMFAWETDHATGRSRWGRGSAELLQVAPDELGDDGAFFVAAADRHRLDAAFAQAVARKDASLVVEFAGQDGRLWRSEMALAYATDGKPAHTWGVTRDISDEARARAALVASEAQFRSTAEALPGILFVTTARGENLYCNRQYRDFTGMSEAELADFGWLRIVHPDDEQIVRDATEAARASGAMLQAEYRLLRHDGAYRWHRTQASPVHGEDGEIERWVGVSIDIHDQRATQEELAHSEQRYRTLFDTMDEGFCIIEFVDGPDGPSSDYIHTEANPAYIRNTGIPDVVGRSVRDVLGDEADRWVVPFRKVAESGEPYRFQQVLEKTDRFLDLAAFRVGDPDRRQVAILFRDRSEEHRARVALEASEKRYRTLFEKMEQGFCVIQIEFESDGSTKDFRYLELNPAFSRESGLPPDVLGQPISKVLPGLGRDWYELYADVARTGRSKRDIRRVEELDRILEIYAFRFGKPEDNQVAVLFNDVSERVRNEDALHRSESELRLRLNAIPQMVWSTRPDGFHDFYSDRWYEFTGTPTGSTDGEGWTGMVHPEDQPRAWERWHQCLKSGDPYEIEYRLRHHTGEYRCVLARALPISNEDGVIVRWMGTCTDINDRIAAGRALRESEARLRAVFDAMPVGLVFGDAQGAVTGGNLRAEEIIGHRIFETARPEDYGRDYIAFHGDGRQVESSEYPLARVISGAELSPELECQVQRSDGTVRWVRYVAAPIVDEDGAIAGGVVASLDIDAEKRLTLSLEAEVERVVAEREAAQDALRQSQKLEAMGQLTGGVAHDFNNLLTPIIGSLDLLQRKQILDERTGRLVDGALASAEKARVLVQRLLAFARRQPLKPSAVDLGKIVHEMSELIDSTSGPRVRVDVSVPRRLPAALADGNQVEMALLNLSVNARDAMPDGGSLTIAVRSEPGRAGLRLGLANEPHLVLAVSDTGQGMDEDTRRRAIEPFFSTKGIGKGTGLGLSMVHGLAAQLGGALDIRSAPGVGTTVELWLPIASTKPAIGSPEAIDPERNGVGTALLVDDEELVRASTAGMLTDLGYSVVEADSGEEALRKLEAGLQPDLLITDQLMPGISGTDLAVRLRGKRADLPVLIVSGYADLDSLSPAFPHLSKPFRQAELAAALEKLAVG